MTSLFGGCLRVEDGAIYKGYGITTTTGSNATVSVKNATLNHDGYQLSFAEGTSLQAAGVSTITASSLNMADGSTLSFGISAENKDEAVLTLAGAFNLAGHLSVNLLFSEDLLVTNEYKLFAVNNTPTWWTPENVCIQGDSNWNIDYDDLRWVDGILVLKMELIDWTNENGNGIWSSSDSSGPQDGDIVLFDDAGSGVVQLEGELKPGFVLVNNGDAHDYTWTGDGYLSGEMIVQKRGEGSLTRETQNQYSGGTVLEAGRLVAGHEMAFGSGEICVKGGELDANHVAIANDILATGGTLSGLDNYAGSLTVDGDVSLSEGITTAQQLIHKSGTLSGGSVSGSNLLILGGTQDFTLVGENTLMDGSVLSQALHNEGVLTVGGQIDVSQLELHYEAAGRVNAQGDEIAMSESGFGKAFYYGVQLTVGAGTVVDGGASITHEETDYTLTLQSNGVASYGGEVDYSHFFLEGNDCYGVSALEAQTGVNLRMVSMSSGTLDVDDDVKVQATGGSIHIVRDAKLCGLVENVALTVSAAADVRADIKGTSSLALENAQVRLSGENSFNGGISSQGESQLSVESADPLMLAQSISNTGTLSLSGAFELSQLAKESLPTTWVNAAGIVGGSGFSSYGGYTVQMVQGGNVKDAGVILTSGLDTLKLGEDGVATRKADVDYSHYAVATGDVVSISEINRVATGNGCALTSISTTGGRLTLDADVSGSLTLDSGNLIIGMNTVVVSDTLTLGTELQVTLTDTYTGGLVYTLIKAESIEGKCEGWEISSSPRQTYTLYIEDNALKMLVEGDVAWLTWANDKKAVWREAAGGWQNGESFYQGDHATIGDGTVTIEGVVKPSSILLNPTKSLTFKTKFDKKTGLWSGAIDGEDITLTIAAGPKGKVTLNDGNTYTGETIIESGTVNVGGVDSFGESDITLSGGTLDLKSKAVDN
ncbi:MAG: hypothetical protein II349_01680, partial [Akkermansia sp.]|nr:hypothetical protein [Akkermansia sp.]